MSVIDLSRLPAPKVIEELSFESILQQRKDKLVGLYPDAADVIDNESEPLCYLLQESAYREMVLRQRVNEAALATMLAFAQGSDLDQQAANLETDRLEISPATDDTPAVMESDDSLRVRAQQSFNTLTVAGPRSQYETIGKSADGRIADVSAISPAGAEVAITVLSRENDGTAPQELLDKVDAVLSADNVRPIGDRLHVQSAVIEHYNIDAVLHIPHGPEQAPIELAASEALAAWLSESILGRSVRRTQIISLLHVPGVKHVELNSPAADVLLDRTKAAFCDSVSIVSAVDHG